MRAPRALGIVEIRHGHGTFVGKGSLAVLAPSLTFQLRSRRTTELKAIHDLVEVRELIEIGLIGPVAEAGLDDDHLSGLEDLVSTMAEDPGADRAFHARLHQNTGNQNLLQLIWLLWDSYHAVEDLFGHRRTGSPRRPGTITMLPPSDCGIRRRPERP